MSAIKRGIGTFAGVYAAMIVILWPSIRVDLQPDTRASKLIVIEKVSVGLDNCGPVSFGHLFAYATLSAMIGLFVWSVSGEKKKEL